MKMRGYSYLEVILIIFIITIISSIVLLNIKNNKIRNLNIASLQLVDDIKYIQELGMCENREYQLTNPTKDYYWILYKDNNVLKFFQNRNLPNGVYFQNQKTIAYTKRGTPKMGDRIFLCNGKYFVEITITPASGRVAIVNSNIK